MLFKSGLFALTVLLLTSFNAVGGTDAFLSFSPLQMRAAAPSISNSAAYVQITNHGKIEDRLIAVRTEIAKHVEIHSMELENGVMRMRPIDSALSIAPGKTVHLVPGGLHIMLMGLTGHLAVDSQHDMVFVFEKAGEIIVSATVKKPDDLLVEMPNHRGHDVAKHTQ